MKWANMNRKESVANFIKRKNIQFKKENLIPMKDIGRKGRFYLKREAWTFLPQSNLKNDKVFILERLKKEKFTGNLSYKYAWKKGDIEYRLGYFIVGKIGRAKGRWIWGQFCPLIPVGDFLKLINKAKKERIII